MITDQEVLLQGGVRTQTALRVLRFVEKSGGATSDECIQALGIPHQTCSPRFTELVQAGCLSKTGVKRKTTSGGLANVYTVVNPDFNLYLNRRTEKATTPTNRDVLILKASNSFLRGWDRDLPVTQQTRLLKKLIRALENADSVA